MPMYEWVTAPPIEEIASQKVAGAVKQFVNSLADVAQGAQTFGNRLATKASSARTIASQIKGRSGHRVFGYKLDGLWVGLIEITVESDHIKIEFLAGHAGAENAGDILIEHVLQFAPTSPPLVKLFAADDAALARYKQLGFDADPNRFVKLLENEMVLDLSRTPATDRWANTTGSWKRLHRFTKYARNPQ